MVVRRKRAGAGTKPRRSRRAAARHQADSGYLHLLELVVDTANAATSIDEPLRRALEAVCRETGWPVGHVYLKAQDRDEMVPTDIWHLDDKRRYEAFRKITMATPLRRGAGLPGRVLETGRPLWVDDVSKSSNFPRNKAAGPINLKAAFGFPVRVGREVAAVLEFFTPEKAAPEADFLNVMGRIGIALGRAMERMRAEEAFSMLASAVSGKTGDDFFATLCAQLIRTLRADFVFIGELADEGQAISTVAAADRGGPMAGFTYRLEGTPCENVITREFCSYPSGVQKQFPKDAMLVDMGIESYVGTPLLDTSGEVLGLLVALWKVPPANIRIAESMTQIFAVRASTELDRRRSAGELRKLSALPEMTPHPLMEFAADGTLKFYNEAARRLMRSLGKTDPWDILPSDTVGIVRKCLATGKNGLIFDTVGGENRTLSWSFIPIPASNTVYAHAFELSLFMDLREELHRQTGSRLGHLAEPRPRTGLKIDIDPGKVH